MRKQIFVCGIALCLALSMAGCGKSPEERQAANGIQSETELVREDAGESAHELYEANEEASGITEASKETVVEPLPELVNSEWFDFKVQIYDMVFTNDWYMTEEDIRKIVEGSAYNVELIEGSDDNGDVCLNGLEIDGNYVHLWKKNRNLPASGVNYGLLDDGYYYDIECGFDNMKESRNKEMENKWYYDKASTEFENLKSRDDVLAYLSENSFVEAEKEQATYYEYFEGGGGFYGHDPVSMTIFPDDEIPVEFADVPHYYCDRAQSITFYRIHKVSETDQAIKKTERLHYSGAHLNYVNSVTFEFDIDGTITSMSWKIGGFKIAGNLIDY